MRKYGPKSADHHSIGELCPACKQRFVAGDFTALIPLGPGRDPVEQRRAREGRPYNAVVTEVHWACATGELDAPEAPERSEDLSAAERALEVLGRE